MSKINAVRFINLNYNNNSIKISDETFQMQGKSTLLSLRNGGGKSVLVQMMMAPFVHKKYRNTKDRPFESYFSTAKPTFIMVEWSLDGGAGYCLTGMMVRKSQNMEEDNNEQLEMINFISEYKERCEHDIYHIPVVDKTQREVILKGFHVSKQLFDTYKRDHSKKFFYYDMNQSAQQKQYFDKLAEYQINYKEWESIIKKVNERESGLSELFSDCKNEKELIEKWFLPTIESKLDKDRSRMKEFQNIVEKYVGQYKNNKSKIERKQVIQQFLEEAEEIGGCVDEYARTTEALKYQENCVACLRDKLQIAEDEEQRKKEETREKQRQMQQEMAHITYEKMSKEIYELMDQELFQIHNRDLIGVEKDVLEREAKEAEKQIDIYSCAKQQEQINEYRNDADLLLQKIELAKDKNRDLEPERNQLGGILKTYYEECIATHQELIEEQHRQIEDNHDKQEEQKNRNLKLQEQCLALRDNISRLKETKRYYDRVEEQFNKRYQEQLARNIMGEYEPGLVEIKREAYKKELEELKKQHVGHKKKLEEGREKSLVCQRAIEDNQQLQLEKKNTVKQIEMCIEDYDRQLSERLNIMKYFAVDETQQWNLNLILEHADKKILEADAQKRELEKEEDILQREWKKLTTGKILELDEGMEQILKEMELHYIYGMDWLGKNAYSKEENETLVRNNPFLPYSLILSQKELQKLKAGKKEIFTSFPVPIITREQLESATLAEEGNIIECNGIHFLILFNEQLLDQEGLRRLILQKEAAIHKLRGQIAIRKEEYRDYVSRREKVQIQTVTKEKYQNALRDKQETQEQIQSLEKEFISGKENLAEILQEMRQIENIMTQESRQIISLTERENDYEDLVSEYGKYLEAQEEIEDCREKLAQTEENTVQIERYLDKLQEQCKTLEWEMADTVRKRDELLKESGRYAEYEARSLEDTIREQMQQLAVRYEAITNRLSTEMQDLEEQKRKAMVRLKKAQKELQDFAIRHRLVREDWQEISYLEEEALHQEQVKQEKEKELRMKEKLWNDVDKKIAVIKHSIEEHIKDMQKQCDRQEPMPKEEIQTRDYDAALNQLQYQIGLLTEEIRTIEETLKSIGENLNSLADYADFAVTDENACQIVIKEMNARELREYKGTMLRDYRLLLEERNRRKSRLDGVLNKMIRKPVYQDDYYRKPLESMLTLTEEVQLVQTQLEITIRSYQTVLEKLEVDIVLIEQEKEKVMELLKDYILEVHQNLGRIDSNSTITIRDKSVKMLRIELPDWNSNEGQYQIRLSDFLDDITRKGVSALEKNENPQEIIGATVTVKNLYDSMIGIGNVQIKLFKIEEQREYPITWSEVARNSGGEGFLSAFVILSSLLYFMRKDDSDIFADRNEGKVLLMDNPFAQTNAAHLLKPLMDMAKKTNTQLICLSGLGGDSIYGRFDNIFVLNLVNASFRGGLQYLKGEHTRGSEEETMIASRVEVIEQQSLLF